MRREEVFTAINSERVYQENLIVDIDRPDMIPDLHVGDTLAAIQYNLNKAFETWYKGSVPHEETSEYLRKIAALCVYVGERYGMPNRKS